MQVIKKHKLLKISLVVAFAVLSLGVNVVGPKHVSADTVAGVYQYQIDAQANKISILCQGEFGQPHPECPDVTAAKQYSSVVSLYSYVAGSKYTFKSSANPAATITIGDPNNPGTGTYTYPGYMNGAPQTVTVGSPDIFKGYFGLISKGSTVNLTVNLDFGKTDSSLALPISDGLAAKISPSSSTLGPEILLNFSQPKPLNPNPIVFTTPITGLTAGLTYRVCVNGSYTIGADGSPGGSVCGNVLAASSPQNLSLTIKGDPSVLQTEQCIAQTGDVNTCTDSKNSQSQCKLDPSSCVDGAVSNPDCQTANKCTFIEKYIYPLINLLSALVGLAVTISIVVGGIQYSSSSGDPQKTAAAQSRIRNSIIALITFIFLYAMLNFLVPGGLF